MRLSSETYIITKRVYKHLSMSCAEHIEKHSRKHQNNSDNNTKSRDKLAFEKHLKAILMRLFCEEMKKVRSICTKYEVIFS